MKRFGVVPGLSALYKMLGSKGPPFCLTIPQSKTAITARPGTSDVSVFEQVFVWSKFPFKESQRGEHVILVRDETPMGTMQL